jgi:hypothetical protein
MSVLLRDSGTSKEAFAPARSFDPAQMRIVQSGKDKEDLLGKSSLEIWAGRNPMLPGSTALDMIAGGRYWHQETDITGSLVVDPLVRETARSGSVDWVDPFVGMRFRNQIGPGEELMIRADFGGFGVGSDFSWQVLATYNWQICTLYGHVLDGGYRALSVDYSQGSGTSRYEYDVLQQGPVIGSTLHF